MGLCIFLQNHFHSALGPCWGQGEGSVVGTHIITWKSFLEKLQKKGTGMRAEKMPSYDGARRSSVWGQQSTQLMSLKAHCSQHVNRLSSTGTRPSMDQATEAPATEKMGTTVIPILHMGQLRHNQGKGPAQHPTARRW